MTREEVYELIDGELKYARKWDDQRSEESLKDKDKPVESWILWMEQYLSLARQAATESLDKTKALDNLRKVTALGVACMEYNDTPIRSK